LSQVGMMEKLQVRTSSFYIADTYDHLSTNSPPWASDTCSIR
jgi:hypothetical protein